MADLGSAFFVMDDNLNSGSMLVKQDQNVEECYLCTELPYLCPNYIIYIQSAIYMSKTAICISKSGDLFPFYI